MPGLTNATKTPENKPIAPENTITTQPQAEPVPGEIDLGVKDPVKIAEAAEAAEARKVAEAQTLAANDLANKQNEGLKTGIEEAQNSESIVQPSTPVEPQVQQPQTSIKEPVQPQQEVTSSPLQEVKPAVPIPTETITPTVETKQVQPPTQAEVVPPAMPSEKNVINPTQEQAITDNKALEEAAKIGDTKKLEDVAGQHPKDVTPLDIVKQSKPWWKFW